MKAHEYFAGFRSIWKILDKKWFFVLSVEINPSFNCNCILDILEFNPTQYETPDFIWASPVCTSFSIAAISHHRFQWWLPKTQCAILWDKMVLKTLSIIRYYISKNPNLVWHIENPRWYLRKMPYMQDLSDIGWARYTVAYCQYWDNRMKPTDIWTNNTNWRPKQMCKNWDKCHESAPRWSKTGTQWLKWSKERSIIPKELCNEIVDAYILRKNLLSIH